MSSKTNAGVGHGVVVRGGAGASLPTGAEDLGSMGSIVTTASPTPAGVQQGRLVSSRGTAASVVIIGQICSTSSESYWRVD